MEPANRVLVVVNSAQQLFARGQMSPNCANEFCATGYSSGLLSRQQGFGIIHKHQEPRPFIW